MKPLYFVIFFSPQFFIGQQSALLGIDFGMTKTQVKKEINTNKKTYKKIRLGGYFGGYIIRIIDIMLMVN